MAKKKKALADPCVPAPGITYTQTIKIVPGENVTGFKDLRAKIVFSGSPNNVIAEGPISGLSYTYSCAANMGCTVDITISGQVTVKDYTSLLALRLGYSARVTCPEIVFSVNAVKP